MNKFVVYYRVAGGVNVNRGYPEYPPTVTDVRTQWQSENPRRIYLQHEPHDEYTTAFAPMVGLDEVIQRRWLAERVRELDQRIAAAQQAKAASMIAGTGEGYGGLKPGDMTIDQNGRRGRVPNVPVEVFRDKPIDPEAAHRATRDMCKGG